MHSEALWQICYWWKLVKNHGNNIAEVKICAQISNNLPLIYSQSVSLCVLYVLSLKGKRVVSERVEKSSPASLAGIKHSTEGGGEPLDTTTGRKDCPKSQVTFSRHVYTFSLPWKSIFIAICICLCLMHWILYKQQSLVYYFISEMAIDFEVL